MSTVVRRAAYSAALAMMAVYGYIALSGPQGIPALRKKWTEIRQLEEDVANLKRDNQAKKDHIRRIETDPAEQEMEIRKRLKLLRPGETSFILPETSKGK
ncbi:MAG TPA: septum formation initiator family protein [Isosphaeraceae bacterium]|nr:septum formation initiator family protein [Isosphaeraceae bacterium]